MSKTPPIGALRALGRRGLGLVRALPLTPPGAAVLTLALVAFLLGRRQIDLVLTLAGLWGFVLLGTLGLAALLARIMLARALAKRERGAQRIDGVEGMPCDTGLRLPRQRILLAREPRWRLDTPDAAVESELLPEVLLERLRPRDRTLGTELRRRFEVEDLFGLWRFAIRDREPRTVRVLPHTGRYDATALENCLASGDLDFHPHGKASGDRVDTRPYVRSDPARMILWKVYARRRELMVRAPETARTPEARPLVYFVAGPSDAAAAGLARLLVESGLLGDGARFAASGTPEPMTEREAVLDALARSAAHREDGAADLAPALAAPELAPGDPVVLVCPAHAGRWQRAVLDLVARDPGRVFVLAAGDASPPRPAESRWRRWLFEPPKAHDAHLADMQRAVAPLAASGARVALADRASGRVQVLGRMDTETLRRPA